MATLLYDTGRNAFLTPNATGGQIDFIGNTISAMLINTTVSSPYVFNAVHTFYSDVAAFAGAIVAGAIASSVNLSSKTAVAGAAFCANITFSSVPITANPVSAIIIYKNTGTAATSLLIAYIDSAGATGIPAGGLQPNGSSITLIVPVVSPGLFKL